MFSRAAKSIVQSLNRRSYHVTKGNFKAAVESTGEVGNSTAQLSQQPRLDSSVAQEIMPFKNLRFKNITSNLAEGQTLSGVGARAVKGAATEGNVQAVDLVQLRGLGPIISNVNGTPGFYKNLQNVRNGIHTVAKRNFSTLQPTFHNNNNNNKFVDNASRSYSKCSGKKDGCDAPAKPCSKSKPSPCPDPSQRVISPCKSRPPCTPAPQKCEIPCDKPKCPPPCPAPPPKCPPQPCPPPPPKCPTPCSPPPPKCPPPCPPPAPKCPPTCFPPPTKCPRPTPKCPPPCPPRPCDPCPKPCKPPKCPPRCPLDPPPPCPPPPPPPPPKCPEPPKKCCDKPEPPPCPPSKQTCPKPCSGPKPAPHSPTPRESCSAPKRSCEVPLEKMLKESRKRSPPKTACSPPPTPPPPRSICCPTPPKETCCPSPAKETCCPPPKPMPNCVPPEPAPKPCPEQKTPCPPPKPTCVPPEPAPTCCPKEPPCPAEQSPCGCTPAPKAKGFSACFQNMGKKKNKTTRQSFWKKLTRKMSTHSGNRGVLKTGQPRFKVPSRTFGVTVFNLAANRGSKCKTGKDICAELDPVCKRLCKKKPATRCSSAEKPSCGERMRIAKKAREAEDERSQKRPSKCPTCLPPERCQPPVVPPASEKMEYPVTVCAEAPPCPSYKDKVDAEPVLVCPPLPQLPKPPSAPVVLCPCPPPPKLPPGPCPCLDSAKEVKLLVPIYLPPCARRAKYTCDQKVYSCKLQRDCDKRACPRDDESHLN